MKYRRLRLSMNLWMEEEMNLTIKTQIHTDMKKLNVAFIGLLLLAAPIQAKTGKSPVKFDSYEWNFGQVDPQKGTVCHTFTLKNTSDKPVRIGKAIPSCECIQASIPPCPLPRAKRRR